MLIIYLRESERIFNRKKLISHFFIVMVVKLLYFPMGKKVRIHAFKLFYEYKNLIYLKLYRLEYFPRFVVAFLLVNVIPISRGQEILFVELKNSFQ